MLAKQLLSLLTIVAAYSATNVSAKPVGTQQVPLNGPIDASTNATKVDVELYVMSKCPDARLCEMTMDKVLGYPGIPHKVNLKLSYIGEREETAPNGVSCMHGESECQGNIQQLCVAQHSPPKQWWPFITCQSFGSLSDIGKVDYARECAKTVGIPWVDSGVETCVNGSEGTKLLQKSIARSKEAGISTSCTITMQDKVRCVHDGTWRNCEGGHDPSEFVATIEREYKRLNSE